MRLVYAPQAVVYNRGPERTKEFIVQRRRIFAGEVRLVMRYGYFTSSMNLRYVLPVALEAIRSYPRFVPWTVAAMAVEAYARLLGLCDALSGREDVVWPAAETTKTVATPFEPLTLISVKWSPGSLDAMAFLRDLRHHSEPAGSVFWWDGNQGEILLFVSTEDTPLQWLQDRIEGVTREHVRPHPVYSNSARRLSVAWVKPMFAERQLVSCRLVKFTAPALR